MSLITNYLIKSVNLILIIKRKCINFSRLHIYFLMIDIDVPRFKGQKTDDIIIKVCKTDDFFLFGKDESKFRNEVKDGNILVGAFKNNELVGYNWISLNYNYVPEIERYAYFNGAYLYRLFVFPEFRRKGIAKNLLSYSISLVKEEFGIKDFYTIVKHNNKNSKKTFESLNFVLINSMIYYRFFFWKKYKDDINDENIRTFLKN